MTCYLFGGTKGGVGKSTMAVNAAAWLAEDVPGKLVALLDTDVQKNAFSWARLRLRWQDEEGLPPDLTSGIAHGAAIRGAYETLTPNVAHIVIDAGGRDSADLRLALTVADVLVMPFLASQFDLYSVRDMAQLVEEARGLNPKLRAIAFVNRASTNWTSTQAEAARAAISEVFPVASTLVRQRQAFATCAETGKAAHEMGRRGDLAAMDFTSVWLEIEEEAK